MSKDSTPTRGQAWHMVYTDGVYTDGCGLRPELLPLVELPLDENQARKLLIIGTERVFFSWDHVVSTSGSSRL
jgi:hypothetical protein